MPSAIPRRRIWPRSRRPFILISAGIIGWAAVARLLVPADQPLREEWQGMAMAVSVALTLGLVLWQGAGGAAGRQPRGCGGPAAYLGDLVPNVGAIISLWASARLEGSARSTASWRSGRRVLVVNLRIGKGARDALMDRAAEPEVIEDPRRRSRGPGRGFTALIRKARRRAARSSSTSISSWTRNRPAAGPRASARACAGRSSPPIGRCDHPQGRGRRRGPSACLRPPADG